MDISISEAITSSTPGMEVRVERSKRRVVLVLNGVHGPLQWRDLQTGGTVLPSGAQLDDPVGELTATRRRGYSLV